MDNITTIEEGKYKPIGDGPLELKTEAERMLFSKAQCIQLITGLAASSIVRVPLLSELPAAITGGSQWHLLEMVLRLVSVC